MGETRLALVVSHSVERVAEIGGQRAVDLRLLARLGMLEGDPPGVQHVALGARSRAVSVDPK